MFRFTELSYLSNPAEAERAGFDVLLTADKNKRCQQNLAGRKIALFDYAHYKSLSLT